MIGPVVGPMIEPMSVDPSPDLRYLLLDPS